MRGYFTFVLVFVSVFLLINLFQSYSGYATDKSKQIAIDNAYYLQLNAKHAILEAAGQGAEAGLLKYMAITSKENYKIRDAKKYAEETAFEYVKKLSGFKFDPDFQVIVWCGHITENTLKKMKAEMIKNGKPSICDGCFEISDDRCKEFINVDFGADGKPAVWLGENNVEIFSSGVIGVLAYSERWGVSGVDYMPQNEKRWVHASANFD